MLSQEPWLEAGHRIPPPPKKKYIYKNTKLSQKTHFFDTGHHGHGTSDRESTTANFRVAAVHPAHISRAQSSRERKTKAWKTQKRRRLSWTVSRDLRLLKTALEVRSWECTDYSYTARCSEIGSLWSVDAPEFHGSMMSENQFHCTRLCLLTTSTAKSLLTCS